MEPQCTKKSLCRRLLSILGEAGQHQLQRSTTREDAILDLFCTNKPGLIKNIDTIPGISDHDGVIIVDTAVRAQLNKKTQRKVPIWKRADWETMKKKTTTFGDKFLADHEQHTVEENWTKFHDHIGELIASIPSKLTSSRNNLPWMTSHIKRLCRKKRRLYNAAKKKKKDKFWDAYRKLQDKTGNALRTAHWDYVNGIISDGLEKGNHQPFWSYIKHQRQDGQGVAPLRVGSQLYIDSASKAATLSEQFKSVFTRDSPALANKRLNPEAQYHWGDIIDYIRGYYYIKWRCAQHGKQ